MLSLSTDTLGFIAPISVALFFGGVAYLIYSYFNNPDAGVQNRLKSIGRGQVQPGMTPAQASNAEKFQKMLEEAAPKLAEQLMPQNQKEQGATKLKLAHAGFRGEHVVAKYLVIQFSALMVGLCTGLPLFYARHGLNTDFIMYSFLWTGFFFYLPNLVLWFKTRSRKEAVFLGLPDALDLMVVCVEAGLGLDAAMRKVSEEMARSRPVIAEEFSICNFQLQMGRARREVLHDLGQRTGVDDMKSLAAILIQADRFGASIGTALRVQSDAMRVRRRQLAEERAAKTAVQLIFPLVLFIFPAIFVVLVGPAAIQIMDTMKSM